MSENANNENIVGDPLPLVDLLELMGVDDNIIDVDDIESALEWWDIHASNQRWVGALEAPFYEDSA